MNRPHMVQKQIITLKASTFWDMPFFYKFSFNCKHRPIIKKKKKKASEKLPLRNPQLILL